MGLFRRRHEPAAATHEPVAPDLDEPQRLELSAAERAWMSQLRAAFADPPSDADSLGRLVDEAWDDWAAHPQGARPDPNPMINALGVALGDLVCGQVPEARWIAFRDRSGVDLAVTVGDDGPLTFPTNAVGKRWSTGEHGWVPGYVSGVAQQMSARPDRAVQDAGHGVLELGRLALEHAVRSVVPDGGPLIPFAIVESAEGRSLQRFVGELAECHQRSRDHVRAAAGATCAAIAWDGYLTSEGRREDAVFVEAGEPGSASVIWAHRYRETPEGTLAVGGPVVVGSGPPMM